jgi:hypothetical protein
MVNLLMAKIPCLFVTILIVTFFSCDTKQKSNGLETFTRADFKEQSQLSGSVIDLPGIFRPRRIKVIPEANLLIVLESQASEFYASVFTLDSIKFKQKLVKNGNGEGEQLSPMSIQYVSSEKRIYIFDHLLQSFFYYAVDSIIKGSDGRANGVIKNPKAILTTNTNTKILLNPVVTEKQHNIISIASNLAHEPLHLLDFYDHTFRFINGKGKYPAIEDSFPHYAYREVFLGNVSYPNPNTIVYSHYNTDILSIYDTSGTLIKSKQGPDSYIPDYGIINSQGGKAVAPRKNGRLCYLPSVRSIDNKLLTLYSGNLHTDRNENGKEMFLFSEKLEPEKYFKLDKKIFDFDIDSTNRYIYGLSSENRPHIVLYKM